MKQQTTAALYCRLSKDDILNGDSMSIQNQKELLGNFAAQNGFPVTEYYVDDGYSGTNFERPSFKRMISDIEDGRIGTVIVKDLSRLGREYLQTGYFTELDEDIVHMLIEKICIHEREIIDGKAQLKVDIYYRFIGMPSSEDSLVLQRKKGHKG